MGSAPRIVKLCTKKVKVKTEHFLKLRLKNYRNSLETGILFTFSVKQRSDGWVWMGLSDVTNGNPPDCTWSI